MFPGRFSVGREMSHPPALGGVLVQSCPSTYMLLLFKLPFSFGAQRLPATSVVESKPHSAFLIEGEACPIIFQSWVSVHQTCSMHGNAIKSALGKLGARFNSFLASEEQRDPVSE